MGKIVRKIKNIMFLNKLTRTIYMMAREGYHEWNRNDFITSSQDDPDTYEFIDRQKHSEDCCIILAGYKQALWQETLTRIARFIPANIDVCIISSGLKSQELIDYCNQYGWSYLSTTRNSVTYIQNVAIELHPSAKWIYKIDEDMFITKGFFENMKATYTKATNESRYEVNFVAPLIPVNGYGYVRILESLNLVNKWEEKFGPLYYSEGLHHHTAILDNPEAAKFMWGDTVEELRNIDRLNDHFQCLPTSYSICPMRFSIGAVYFSKDAFLSWGGFPVIEGHCLGLDEERMCYESMFSTRAIIVSENSVVGHIGYGPQSKVMLQYYIDNQVNFQYQDNL